MRKKIYMFAMMAMAMFVVSCEEDYKLYDTTQTDSVFFNYVDDRNKVQTEVDYNFGFDIAQEHEIKIPVNLMGVPKAEVRQIGLQVVAEKTDMVEGVNYTIERAAVRADKVIDTVIVKLLRDKDLEIQTKTKQLTLEIVDNGNLRPTGQNTFTIKYDDIRPTERPSWWSTWAPIPVYSFENAQLFFKYFHELLPKANQEIYDEIIKTYGKYFEETGDKPTPFTKYRTLILNYVLVPMYNETQGTDKEMQWYSVPSI